MTPHTIILVITSNSQLRELKTQGRQILYMTYSSTSTVGWQANECGGNVIYMNCYGKFELYLAFTGTINNFQLSWKLRPINLKRAKQLQ